MDQSIHLPAQIVLYIRMKGNNLGVGVASSTLYPPYNTSNSCGWLALLLYNATTNSVLFFIIPKEVVVYSTNEMSLLIFNL